MMIPPILLRAGKETSLTKDDPSHLYSKGTIEIEVFSFMFSHDACHHERPYFAHIHRPHLLPTVTENISTLLGLSTSRPKQPT